MNVRLSLFTKVGRKRFDQYGLPSAGLVKYATQRREMANDLYRFGQRHVSCFIPPHVQMMSEVFFDADNVMILLHFNSDR